MIIIMLGPPGSGKTTQSKYLAEKLGVPSISMGQVLRDAKKAKTSIGLEASKYVEEGKLVPAEIIQALTRFRLEEDDCKGGFVLDGAPRKADEAVVLDEYLEGKGEKIDKVISIEIPDSEIIKRLTLRFKLPKEQGGKRADDNIADIKVRIDEYKRNIRSLKLYYQNKDLLEIIDGIGSREEVRDKIAGILQL